MKQHLLYIMTVIVVISAIATGQTYTIPEESAPHEGTWLQWPHNDLYGPWYRDDVEPTWIAMTRALQDGENVHIIAADSTELSHIVTLLNSEGIPMTDIDFFVFPTDDVWIRDNGPIFVYDNSDNLAILDWGFNGWGLEAPYSRCDVIPSLISADLGLPCIDLSAMVLEGGAIEHDGNGTMMATRSSITHSSRNPSLTETQIEDYLQEYMGITKFIWLDGVYGLEITDMHIDGFMKFVGDSIILTMSRPDLIYWDVPEADIDTLFGATNADGIPYDFAYVPLTERNVRTEYGRNLGYKGSYINYYIGNDVVLVPTYNDPNDSLAIDIIQSLYPDRTAIGIDVRNLYEYGGMIHCVTQQQPVTLTSGIKEGNTPDIDLGRNSPNPFDDYTTIDLPSAPHGEITLDIFDVLGKRVRTLYPQTGSASTKLSASDLESGIYLYTLKIDGNIVDTRRMVIKK